MPVQDPSERSTYPANVFPSRRAEEATAPARGTIEQQRADEPQIAARRADGLATSEALELLNDTPTNFRPRKTQTRRGDDSTNRYGDHQTMTED